MRVDTLELLRVVEIESEQLRQRNEVLWRTRQECRLGYNLRSYQMPSSVILPYTDCIIPNTNHDQGNCMLREEFDFCQSTMFMLSNL